jgi:hypothetical protein
MNQGVPVGNFVYTSIEKTIVFLFLFIIFHLIQSTAGSLLAIVVSRLSGHSAID